MEMQTMLEKVFFCAGYVLAWGAVAGMYDAIGGMDGLGPLVGMLWPVYIAWLPVKFVYNQIKKQCLEQLEKKKEQSKSSVPPGNFRLLACKDCAKWIGRPGEKSALCKYCEGVTEADNFCVKFEPKEGESQ